MRAFQKLKDIFFEISAGVDMGLIEKGRCAAFLYLPSDLLRDPSVTGAMTYEDQTPVGGDRLNHLTPILPVSDDSATRSTARCFILETIPNPRSIRHGPLFAADTT